MIISEDHILQEEINNLKRTLLAHTYPLHFIIKNIKKALTYNPNALLFQRTSQTVTNILPIITPFSDIDKLFTATINNWHAIADETTLSTVWPSKPLSATTNPAAFTTIMSTLHKHMAPHGRIPNTTTHIHPHTPNWCLF